MFPHKAPVPQLTQTFQDLDACRNVSQAKGWQHRMCRRSFVNKGTAGSSYTPKHIPALAVPNYLSHLSWWQQSNPGDNLCVLLWKVQQEKGSTPVQTGKAELIVHSTFNSGQFLTVV